MRGPRDLVILALAVVSVIAYIRYRGDLKNLTDGKGQQQAVVDENGDLIVWSADKHAGQTWANLGPSGKIDFPDKSGVGGSGKALTIHIPGDGYRSCGLNWKGWYPADSCDDVTRYNSLIFHIRQTTDVRGADLSVLLVDNQKRDGGAAASNAISVVGDGAVPRIDGEWRKVLIPLPRFTQNRPLRLDRLWGIEFIQNGKGDVVFQIDRIGFSQERGSTQPSFPTKPAYRANAQLVLDGPGHRISDGIYGVCDLPGDRLRHFGITITRWGGNTSSRYNWKINAENGAKDFYFRNREFPIGNLNDNAYLKQLRTAQSAGGTAYVTVPMLGWIAKDYNSYSYSVKKHGPQEEVDPVTGDAGNGKRKDGSLIRGADPTDTSLKVEPDFVADAVVFAVRQVGKADASTGRVGIKYWVLDNEPMIWHETHRDVRPNPLGDDELWERTVSYAEAIKKADPSAKVAGFCSWGWTDLSRSAEWFIRKCGEYQKKNGKPLVDVFDFHWYPQAQVKDKTPYEGKGMDPLLNELRLRSTRDLWDPEYRQESWIDRASSGQATRVIRRVRDWIDKHNPGMEICLGEYNFGGSDNITGGLAQADTFGILAREKVDLAFIWKDPEGTQNLAWTLFRNYDDRGGRFGDTLIPVSSDNRDLAVYAAKRRDGAITIVAINKNLGGPCDFTLSAAGLNGKMRIWRFDQSSDYVYEAIKEARQVDKNISLQLPPASASILVVK